MIGFLRFVGILNAAAWFGSTIFFIFSAGTAPFSAEMKQLLGTNNYPYFSGAVAQIFIARYFHFHLVCAAVAVAHLLAEAVYLGKSLRRFQAYLLAGLCAVVLIGGFGLQPKLKALHGTKYGTSTQPELREAATRSFRTWHAVSQVINLFAVAGLTVYLWRVANPSDATRFVSAAKFTMR